MRWTRGGSDADIEDRRGEGGYSGRGFGGGGMRIGLGGLLVLVVLSVIFRRDLVTPFLGMSDGSGSAPVTSSDPARIRSEQESKEFVTWVLNDLQDTWTREMPRQFGTNYQKATLVLFSDATNAAGCGFAQSASGPFYCPADGKVYIDLSFYQDLQRRFGAPGDFAQAYVIAHEIGHHIQDLVGIERKVRAAQRRNPGAANQLSVRMELQADCLAGVWGHSTAQRDILERGDVEEGLNAAAAIGDDRLQQMSSGRVMPEQFTHGSSAQRVEWFKRGLQNGDARACDTFGQAL